jgi:hypothetical protein
MAGRMDVAAEFKPHAGESRRQAREMSSGVSNGIALDGGACFVFQPRPGFSRKSPEPHA